MPRFHHANLGVPPGVDEAEGVFLVDVVGDPKLEAPPDLQGRARWYEADDHSQIHRASIQTTGQPPGPTRPLMLMARSRGASMLPTSLFSQLSATTSGW